MKLNLSYEAISEKHLDQAVELVVDAYNEERKAIPFLPESPELMDILYRSMSALFCKGTGIAALMDGKLAAFIAGFEVKELWGRCKGLYSPLYGHGAKKEHRSRLYRELYKHGAEKWVKSDITSHALTFFAHDTETIDTWFWLGFGNRCVDSIRQAAPIACSRSDISIKKVGVEDVPYLIDIDRSLHLYFRNSPMFMPRKEVDHTTELTQWLKRENRHMWAACRNGKVIGHLQIEPEAETFIAEHPEVMNITGAYVADSERHTGVAALLLDAVQAWQMDNGYPLCGVDFESFNIDGGDFWNRYFIPYTYSLTRRIDERILQC